MVQSQNSNPGRRRLLIAVAILCGSASAMIFWQNAHQIVPGGIGDEQAKGLGFQSAEDLQKLNLADAKMVKDSGSPNGWDEADFTYFDEALKSGNERKAVTVIIKLGWVLKLEQRRRAMTILGTRAVTKNEREAWAYVFRQWAKVAGDKAIIADVLHSSNADIASIAKEVQQDDLQKSKS